MNETPGIYNEARNRLKEEKEREQKLKEQVIEQYEKQRAIATIEKKFDIFSLKKRLEAGHMLSTLRADISEALKEGIISRETFDIVEKSLQESFEREEKIFQETWENSDFSHENIPFSQTEIAQFFEKKKIGENIFIDIAGFSYGFFVQGSAILVILLWRIFLDFIFLPRDIYHEIKK